MAPCSRRRGNPDLVGQVAGGFLSTLWGEMASREQGCTGYMQSLALVTESSIFKCCANKCHKMSDSYRNRSCSHLFFHLSSRQKPWPLFLACPSCTSADLKVVGSDASPLCVAPLSFTECKKRTPETFLKIQMGEGCSGFAFGP